MKEKCVKKLKEWFGNMKFEYVLIRQSNDSCVFVTISEACKKENRYIEVYHVFQIGSKLEVSQSLEYVVNLETNSSILACIESIIKTYDRI